jgi:hypothetical protein
MRGTYGSLILPPPAEPAWQSHGVRGWNINIVTGSQVR